MAATINAASPTAVRQRSRQPAPAAAAAPATGITPSAQAAPVPATVATAAPRGIVSAAARAAAPVAAAASTVPATVAGGGMSWAHTGQAAREGLAREQARQAELNTRRAAGLLYTPFRFSVAVGQAADIIILDRELGPCFFEHALYRPNAAKDKMIFEVCPKESEPCPLCEGNAGFKDSYYAMYFTVIDMRSVTDKKGVVHPYTRKLLLVKSHQQNYFIRQYDRLVAKQAELPPEQRMGMRGLHLLATRDASTQPAIGNHEVIAEYSEQQIVEAFGHEQVIADDGRVLKTKNADIYAYQYEMLFKPKSAAELRRQYGGVAPAGARDDHDSWGAGPATQGGGIRPAAGGGIQRAASGNAVRPADDGEIDDSIPY